MSKIVVIDQQRALYNDVSSLYLSTYNVSHVHSALEAFDILLDDEPTELLIAEIVALFTDGYETVRDLLGDEDCEIRSVVFVADDAMDHRIAAAKHIIEQDAHIFTKPFFAEELEEVLAS